MNQLGFRHKKRDELAKFACVITEMGAEDALNNELRKKLAKVVIDAKQQQYFTDALCELAWVLRELDVELKKQDVTITTDIAEKILQDWMIQNTCGFTSTDVLDVGLRSGILVIEDDVISFASEEYFDHLAKKTLLEYMKRMSQ